MKKPAVFGIATVFLFVIFIFGFLILKSNDNLPFDLYINPENSNKPSVITEKTNLANPASVYCQEQGGKVEIRRDAKGNETGFCLKDNKECEEWQLFRKECTFESKTATESTDINFVEEGNIINTDPIKSSEGPDFSLLFEKPGKPALKMDLKFTQDSKCDLGSGFAVCETSSLHVGNRVIIKAVYFSKRSLPL